MHWKTDRIRRLAAWTTALLTLALAPQALAQGKFAPRRIDKDQRCPVCHMYPIHYPKWRAEIIFKDNRMTAFDSPADLFRFYHHLRKYDQRHTVADIGAVYVTDYQRGGWVNAKQASFVLGSKVYGPMGSDLPAFAHKAEARRFAAKSGGKVLTFGEVTPMVLQGLHVHMPGGMDMRHKAMNPCSMKKGMQPMEKERMHQSGGMDMHHKAMNPCGMKKGMQPMGHEGMSQ